MFWLVFFAIVSADKYFLCDEKGHACKVGTTCCPRSDGGYGCCPFDSAVCCPDSDGHCCPVGYPICDIKHKKCTNHLSATHQLLNKQVALKSNGLELTEFLLGFAEGLGSEIGGELVNECSNDAIEGYSEIMDGLKYLGGETSLDQAMAYKKIGVGMKYLSQAFYECSTAYERGIAKAQNLIEKVSDSNALINTVIKNIWTKSNYIMRELNGISRNGWELRGYYTGKALNILLED